MSTDREARELRERLEDLDRRLRAVEDVGGLPTRGHYLAASLRSAGSFPGSAGVFFEASRLTVLGVEAEGATPAFTDSGNPIYPLVLGSAAIAEGRVVAAAHAPHRWIAPANASGTGTGTGTVFNGIVRSCGTLEPEASISIARTSDSVVIWTGTQLESMGYSGSITLSAATPVTITATPTSARLLPNTGTATLTPGVINGLPTIAVAPAPGYVCTALFSVPLSTTLHLLDNRYGDTATLVYGAGNAFVPAGGALWTGVSTSPRNFVFVPHGDLFARRGADAASPRGRSGTGPPTVSITYTFLGIDPIPFPGVWTAGDSFLLTE